ncbi:hypothetical protein BKP35_14795 [Anaerobacillus arseniciselenatis]|uniref:DUF5325 family protein n=1 Tax=Anaerobacillus arseniciselenatis TaxID=85682 RepID=A0A1S2LDE7_9BACI|nr:DUF5325 family protein [Anaerobacillus arseniciselenatis]OIJ09757.1 hypothetical protein BKP35_14795 [Anaerobacillus arseniciselenatis]
MKKEQIIFLLCAIFTTFSIIGIGISIALESLLIFSLSILLATICCGVGFTLRKKLAASTNG